MGANFGYNITQNAITQYNEIDTVTGKKTYYPVNVNGNRNWYLWSNYNKSAGNNKPQYAFDINGNGGSYVNFVNSQKATTHYFSITAGVRFGIEKEDVYEFGIHPRIGYNYTKSSLSTTTNNNYISYGGDIGGGFMLPWKLEFETNLNADLRQKINAFATNTNLVIWNATLVKKIFKKDAGKIGFYVNDLLNDNKGFTRNISTTFISEDRYEKISRYFLLKFEWSFTQSPGGDKK